MVLPVEGIYEIEGSNQAGPFEDKIIIGDMYPGEGTIVRVWSSGYRNLQQGDVTVTHTRGLETVDLGYKTTGLWAKMLRNIHLAIIFGPSILILLFLFFSKKTRPWPEKSKSI